MKAYESYSPTNDTIFDGEKYIAFEAVVFNRLSKADKENFLECLQDRLQQECCPDSLVNLYNRLTK